MIAPGYDDGSESPFANLKFPLINDPIMQATGIAPAAFLTPVNSLSAVQKSYLETESNNHRDSPSLKSSHIINTAETMPTFRAGELTVSVKNVKNDYDYSSATDFTKIDSMKNRADYPLTDLTQQLKFPDLSKLAGFSPAELAKLTGFSLGDFTKAASSSAYMRNIASLFSPMGKLDASIEVNDRKSNDFSDMSTFKPSQSSSPVSKDVHKPEEKSKKFSEPMDTSTSYLRSEDLSITLDMSTKKHHKSSEGTLDLSKERQS